MMRFTTQGHDLICVSGIKVKVDFFHVDVDLHID